MYSRERLRRHISSVAFAAITLAACAASRRASAQDSIVAAAWPGVDSSQVGQLYDLDFRPLNQSILTPGQQLSVVNQERSRRERRVELNEFELKAHARAWGLSAGVALGSTHAYVRSVRLLRVEQLPAGAATQGVPSHAAYVVSRVHFGHMYEVHMQGSRAAVQAEVDSLLGGGAIRAVSSQVQVVSTSNGLTPKPGLGMRALAAEVEQDIVANFDVTAEPQAILIEFERVARGYGRWNGERVVPVGSSSGETGGAAPRDSVARSNTSPNLPGALYSLQVVGVRFPSRKPGGQAWDILGGRPDMRATFLQAGRVVSYVDCPRDRFVCAFEPGERRFDVRFGRSNPLTVQFQDLDASDHDFAGEVTVSELHTGASVALAAPGTSAQVLLRVTRFDEEQAAPPVVQARQNAGRADVGSTVGAGAGGPSVVVQAAIRAELADRVAVEERNHAAQPRQLQEAEVRGLLVNRTVSTPRGSPWKFEPAEPFAARIESQRVEGSVSFVNVFVETNSTDGTQPARGLIRLTLQWSNGQPVVNDASSLGFQISR